MREANERFVMGDPLRMWNGLPGVVGSICGVERLAVSSAVGSGISATTSFLT
jgi:hypothetical protein